MAQPITGAFLMKVNGDPFNCIDGVLTPPGQQAEQIRSGLVVAGIRYVKTFPKFACKIPHQAGVSILALASLKDAEITIETDTGSIWQMFGAVANESGELDESSGMITLELLGDDLLEIVA